MSYLPIDSKWKCAQGGGLEIVVISPNDDRNIKDIFTQKQIRTGDVVYVYTHNGKVGSMNQFDDEQWSKEWSLITL